MSTNTEKKTLRAGVAGLGMAGAGILSTLAAFDDVQLVAAADPREQARKAFEAEFGGSTYDSVEQLCDDPEVDAVWIATPTRLHAEHVRLAAERGKHLVVEKPFAVTLEECDEMIEIAQKNHVALVAGGARSFEPAFIAMRKLISSGRLGRLGALNTWSLTGWIIRPREPYEVDAGVGGGTVYNQAPHPVDVLRLLGGGMVKSVRAITSEWMPERPCPGYFTAIMEFENGTPATLSYNGHGYMLGWELLPWGETPARQQASDAAYAYRRALRDASADEYAARETLRFGGRSGPYGFGGDGNWVPQDAGLVVASMERGEIRQSATGLYVYDDEGRHDEEFPKAGGMRKNEVDELRQAIGEGLAPQHDGRWGKATIEVILALMTSSAEHREVTLHHQVPVTKY